MSVSEHPTRSTGYAFRDEITALDVRLVDHDRTQRIKKVVELAPLQAGARHRVPRPGPRGVALSSYLQRVNSGPLSDDGRRRADHVRARPGEAGAGEVTDLIACLPGDGIGPEVLDQAVRVLESLPVDVEIVRAAVRRRPRSTSSASRCRHETLAACTRLAGGAARRGRRPDVGRRRRSARAGPDRAAQGARRLREPAAGARRARST